MPSADFFTRLGVFLVRDFLDQETCVWLRSEARSSRRVQAPVSYEGTTPSIDDQTRRTEVAGVSPAAAAAVEERLQAVKPRIEEHFSVPLDGWTELQFLIYQKGDFFSAHRDRNTSASAPALVRRRRVSAVIFLNGEAPDPAPEAYGGGELTFYGLLGGERGAKVGLPLRGEEGLLVAFDSDVTHAVTPVTHGERYTVVTWFG